MPGWRSRPRSSTSLAHALAEVGSSESRLVFCPEADIPNPCCGWKSDSPACPRGQLLTVSAETSPLTERDGCGLV